MAPQKRLTRSRGDRVIAGVCAGIADYLDTDPTIVRLAWVVLSIFPGSVIGGAIVYLVAALLIPEETPGQTTLPHTAQR